MKLPPPITTTSQILDSGITRHIAVFFLPLVTFTIARLRLCSKGETPSFPLFWGKRARASPIVARQTADLSPRFPDISLSFFLFAKPVCCPGRKKWTALGKSRCGTLSQNGYGVNVGVPRYTQFLGSHAPSVWFPPSCDTSVKATRTSR